MQRIECFPLLIQDTAADYLLIQMGASQEIGFEGSAFGASPPPAFHTLTKKYLLLASVTVGLHLTE